MTVVELAIGPWILTVVKGQIEKRRLLDLCPVESLAKQSRRGHAAIRATKQCAGVKAVSSAAYAGVPSRVSEGLVEHTITAPNNRFVVKSVSEAEPRRECLV